MRRSVFKPQLTLLVCCAVLAATSGCLPLPVVGLAIPAKLALSLPSRPERPAGPISVNEMLQRARDAGPGDSVDTEPARLDFVAEGEQPTAAQERALGDMKAPTQAEGRWVLWVAAGPARGATGFDAARTALTRARQFSRAVSVDEARKRVHFDPKLPADSVVVQFRFLHGGGDA